MVWPNVHLALKLDARGAQGFCVVLYPGQPGDWEQARQKFRIAVDPADGILVVQARRQLDRLE